MHTEFYKSDTRGVSEHGWLSSRFSFSFADYYNSERMNFGALRVLNDDKIAAQNGFGMHEHSDMEIISIPLVGQLQHKDSMGNELTIGPNDVQVMSAGTGVMHSEINPSEDVDGAFLQIWIQTREEGIAPYHDHAAFAPEDQKGAFITLVQSDTAEGTALKIHTDAYISRGRFEGGTTTTYQIKNKGNGAFVFLIEGTATVANQPLEPRDAVGIWQTDSFDIVVTQNADILVIEVSMG